MSRADRAFVAVVTVSAVTGIWLLTPLVLTLFPALVERIVRGSADAAPLCSGVLASVHTELPPLGAAALGLAAVVFAPAAVRVADLLHRSRHVGGRQVAPPQRLLKAAARVGIAGFVVCVDDPVRYAYSSGLVHPHIYISRGALGALRAQELEAVLWHEAHHLRQRDPLRALITRGLMALLPVIPLVGDLARRFALASELEADQAALNAQGDRRWLAGALLTLGLQLPPASVGVVSAWSMTAARIDQLSGIRRAAQLPSPSRRTLTFSGVALLVAFVLLFGQAVRAHLVPLPFLDEAAGAVAHACPLPVEGPLL